MQVIRFIYKNLDHYKPKFWWAMLAGFIYSAASIAIPLFLAAFTTTGLSSSQFPVLVGWLLAAVGSIFSERLVFAPVWRGAGI